MEQFNREIPAREVKAKMSSGALLLLDVREPHEYEEWRIEGSLNVPLTSMVVYDS